MNHRIMVAILLSIITVAFFDTPAGSQVMGGLSNITVTSITNALPAGTNAIGKLSPNSGVDIGDVDVTSISAGDNNIGNEDIVTLPSLIAGNANIGDVDIASIAAGNNNIGDVDIATMPSVTIGTFPDNEPFNVAQFGGTNVVTGTGASGAGIPRVTVANDSRVSTKTALTANAPVFATVGTTSAAALAANTSRTGAVFGNTSVNTISCAIGATAVLNSGITLLAGAVWTMNEYTLATGAINCIAGAAGSNLSIQEFQ